MPKRLTHLITSLQGGGSENYLYQLISRSPSDFEHRVLYLKAHGVIGRRLEALGISVERVEGVLDLYRRLRQQSPDILHTNLFRAHQIGRLIGKLAGVRVIVSSQQAIDAWQKPWHRWLDQGTLRFCDHVLVNSSAAAALVEQRLKGRATPKVHRIENGVDLQIFRKQNRDTARGALGLPEKVLIGGGLFRLHPEKGADFIPRFAQQALQSHPDLHLAIAGVGPLELDLLRQTEGAPWKGRLHWMGWQDDAARFFSSLDFVFSLSREESLPQNLVEASVMSLPWIAPKVGGIPDLFQAGATGLLFEPGQMDQAQTQLTRLIKELDAFSKQAGQASDRLRAFYSLDRMVQRTYDLLK